MLKAFHGFEPKKPIDGNWTRLNDSPAGIKNLEGYRYLSPLGIRVISSVHIVENSDGGGKSPHWHITISDNGQRVPASIVPKILKQFDASDFEEDNHAPQKIIRSFWKRIQGPDSVCPCNENEVPEIHGDYVWRKG